MKNIRINIITGILAGSIRLYQLVISPFTPPVCRFYPTCSAYAVRALEKYGTFRGLGLSFRRLIRCHPLNPGGYDPVP